jgi:hypothetical protein
MTTTDHSSIADIISNLTTTVNNLAPTHPTFTATIKVLLSLAGIAAIILLAICVICIAFGVLLSLQIACDHIVSVTAKIIVRTKPITTKLHDILDDIAGKNPPRA